MIVCEEGELVIGRHSVVGANCIITRSIPPYSVVAGDPARIVKQYDFAKNKWVLGCIRRPTVGSIQEEAVSGINAKAQCVTGLKIKVRQERLANRVLMYVTKVWASQGQRGII